MTNSLYQKIADVSRAIGSLQADKRNTQQNYDYISADKVLERVGSEMAKAGLVIVPALVDERMERVEYQQGKFRYDCRVDIEMKLADGEGNTDTVMWFGRGSDYSVPDKAMYKAITSGHKYFLMKLCNVGVGNEDGEHEVQTSAVGKNGAEQQEPRITVKQRKHLHASGTKLYGDGWDKKRGEMSLAFRVKSSNDWTQEQAARVIEGIDGKLAEREAKNASLFDDEPATEGAYAD